jgi:hypothetical protein
MNHSHRQNRRPVSRTRPCAVSSADQECWRDDIGSNIGMIVGGSRVGARFSAPAWRPCERRTQWPVSGSHEQRIWAYHDGVDLGGPAMARIAVTTAIPLLSCGSFRMW